MKRRNFIQLGVGGTVIVAASGGVLSWFFSGYKTLLGKKDVPIALSVKEFAVARALVHTLLPEEDGFPSGESIGLTQRIDEEVWAASEGLRSDLKNGLQVFEHAPIFLGFYKKFTALSQEDRLKFLDRCLVGQNLILRQLAVGFKQMLHFFYYAHPSVWPLIGYEGPFVKDPVPPVSHTSYQEILRKASISEGIS